ncbi:phosphoglucomutase (alpha-D-glucose-1,6-bisphosphate-dependent) [Acidipropionibacterium jensenii]|uniref:Phosphoglucomutase n=2 Tax=Acidipropionibacterium jensenii TaxID=1749 RepID=A0A3Q9UJG4_9ACTN|nr:phosphoglucomutase (alpha-D-glucose-1,6-bisphosphate-dependent) [Acidipropionibacterium jensenii]AZZ39531.1 alpha-D-glucose phosphate-specific phosphoglucomutase [Acidipropionibacterium jensenii]MDN5978230.1 phosphoglucomutase (alpha-D-glucose-1,6-bisphosphate-dependent) [Acidipropionibacterium jensenii]MDN5997178.1 phosphoglucomutase (alpha-D-glucose-1,6-bisphosphate-dependent) [Acidipropionibacterium jensenii]MDN6427701.1 phosphoglucomutase (alpha-D-glucose-1,6-bisphosphate-dependent) [Aci
MAHPRAGQPAQEQDLIDVDAVVSAYYDIKPDPDNPDQQVVFGTSGHRGSSLDGAFNDAHIAATSQAIVEYRASQGITGPLFIGKDTHALSGPAWRTAIEVLRANDVTVMAEHEDEWTPTPAVSRAIIVYNRDHEGPRADGIVVTPSHNPPRDGGFKYNPPHGGPADTDATSWIASRANQLLADPSGIHRRPYDQVEGDVIRHDYRTAYCEDLRNAIDIDAIARAGVHIGADPLGGASVQYWQYISEHLGLDLSVVNPTVDPTWRFMTLDTDGKIRMDCSSPNAMASLIAHKDDYDIATGNDADSDRHGIVTPDAGLMNPNAYLAVAIQYLYAHRPGWSPDAGVGKTLVSSSLIDRVVGELGRTLVEVPVGFKWFVPGLMTGEIGFGGEESAGASFLDLAGHTWTTDKDGLLLALLASEIKAVTGRSPSEHYADIEDRFGKSYYARIDSDATREQKARLKALSPSDVSADTVAGEKVEKVLTEAPGNGAPIGGIKVITEHAWFAARPSGTESKYKIYAESLLSADHLAQVQAQAKEVVDEALR